LSLLAPPARQAGARATGLLPPTPWAATDSLTGVMFVVGWLMLLVGFAAEAHAAVGLMEQVFGNDDRSA